MKWIYLSPHLDDVIYSCGGLIWEQTRSRLGVEIWTICAADFPPRPFSSFAETLHGNWGLGEDAVKIRKQEDRKASQIVGAGSHYLKYLDCIYRKSDSGKYFYQSEGDLFGGLDPGEADLISTLVDDLKDQLSADVQVVAPLGIGNHVDHELVRKAASRLGIPLFYYADYPYARESGGKEILNIMKDSTDWEAEIYPISEEGIQGWQKAALAYQSQVSTFWEDEAALKEEIKAFSSTMGGVRLWNTSEDV
ncbi:MAG: PIG-L family deacetylase [Anaerolineales bacterium]|nr:PIG-L family deacetylase [Anaerolineales bacterium]